MTDGHGSPPAGQRQSAAAREDPRRLHTPPVHHRRHEAHADREHHRPGRKKHCVAVPAAGGDAWLLPL